MSPTYIASFDLGKKNFAFCIEEVETKNFENLKKELKKIPNNQRYNEDGTPSKKIEKILDEVYKSGKLYLYKNLDLTENCDPKKKLDPETFFNMIDELDKYSDYWDKCSIFIIEEQMSFGKKLNKMAMKLAQHCYSYFAFRYNRFKKIIEFPAYHKTQILGAPKICGKPYKNGKKRYKAMEKSQRKKWCIEKAFDIFSLRKEDSNILKNAKKKDDLADVLCQLQAFKFRAFIDI